MVFGFCCLFVCLFFIIMNTSPSDDDITWHINIHHVVATDIFNTANGNQRIPSKISKIHALRTNFFNRGYKTSEKAERNYFTLNSQKTARVG